VGLDAVLVRLAALDLGLTALTLTRRGGVAALLRPIVFDLGPRLDAEVGRRIRQHRRRGGSGEQQCDHGLSHGSTP
jgi:hypothetical protein